MAEETNVVTKSIPVQVTPYCVMDSPPTENLEDFLEMAKPYVDMYSTLFGKVFDETYSGKEDSMDFIANMLSSDKGFSARRCGVCFGITPGISGVWPIEKDPNSKQGYPSYHPGKKPVSIETQLLVAQKLYDQGIRHLQVTGGDPMFLWKDCSQEAPKGLAALLKGLKEIGFDITLYSDMMGLTSERLEIIRPWVDSFQIPIEGPNPEVHAINRGPDRDFKGSSLLERMSESNVYFQYFDAINVLKKMLPEKRIYVSTVLTSQNMAHINELGEFLAELGKDNPDNLFWRIYRFFPAGLANRPGIRKRYSIGMDDYAKVLESLLSASSAPKNIFVDPSTHSEHGGAYYMSANLDLVGSVRRISEGVDSRVIGHILDIGRLPGRYTIRQLDRWKLSAVRPNQNGQDVQDLYRENITDVYKRGKKGILQLNTPGFLIRDGAKSTIQYN